MAFPDELLELSRELLNSEAAASQARLRRAVSTAYYAFFHLLISAAGARWVQPELRSLLGRSFEHGRMKTACKSVAELTAEFGGGGRGSVIESQLQAVARTFIRSQEERHVADYDLSRVWTPVDADMQIVEVEKAFAIWKKICDEPLAQAFLVSLLGGRRNSVKT